VAGGGWPAARARPQADGDDEPIKARQWPGGGEGGPIRREAKACGTPRSSSIASAMIGGRNPVAETLRGAAPASTLSVQQFIDNDERVHRLHPQCAGPWRLERRSNSPSACRGCFSP
jgi:hypothetical protein